MAKVKVSESVTESVTRSPIELFWTANKKTKNLVPVSLFQKYSAFARQAWFNLFEEGII